MQRPSAAVLERTSPTIKLGFAMKTSFEQLQHKAIADKPPQTKAPEKAQGNPQTEDKTNDKDPKEQLKQSSVVVPAAAEATEDD